MRPSVIMKPKLLTFLILHSSLRLVFAGSAIWNAAPVDNNWNNPGNWTPATVPNGPDDVATFGVSSTTDVSIPASVEVNNIAFAPGASAFTLTLIPPTA